MVPRSMSLRARIVVLFSTALVLTLAVASLIGERLAARALEGSLRDRTVDLARTIADELALSPHTDPDRAARQLGAILTRRRGLRAAQLAIRHGHETKTIHVTFGAEGAVLDTTTDGTVSLPTSTAVVLVDDERARSWRVELPLRDGTGRAFGALRLEASLSEVEEIATTERNVFFLVAGVGATAMALAFSFVLGHWLTRPLSQLAGAMEAVASGDVDETHVPGTGRADEVGVVARGLSGMLARIRRFNGELQGKVDAAVAGVARKNRELAEVNQLLVEARRDLTSKERLAALGQISGTIAHELGNPLNTISGHIQLLARAPGATEDSRAGLEIVDREVKRMTAIIRRFLDSARSLAPVPEQVDVAALLDEAVTLSVPVEAQARIEVHREVEPGAATVRADPALLRHVLGNLIANAVDAMPQGGTLTIRAARDGRTVSLAVDDTGVGIGPEQLRHLFEPLYTTKPRGKGTGLGLSISREIAGALRGRIEVESRPGRGSRFTLTFPEPTGEPRPEGGADGAAVARPGCG
jgi:two-component system, NtrC family, sensor kinase